ncbi:hypothetical protein GJ496_008297 [Pomphorhynchus laevis]|nr:hypothetical protein GJ496_008297 [Pomphorhynchus laevis]
MATCSVSDSISIVIHTVDSKLGAPDPSELAFQMQKIKKLKADANNREEQGLPAIDQEDCKLQKSNPTIGSPLYVEKFTNFISKPEISKIFNTERQLKGVTSKLLRSGKSSDNANNVSHTLSELASRNNDVSKMDGLNPQISKVEANALEKLISTSKLSEEKLKLICIKDSSIDRMVSNIKSDLEIGDDRVTFNGTFFDFINAFNDKAKSLPIDKHSIKLTLNTINDNVQELNDADTFTVKATVDCCEESVQMLEDAVISLLCELIGLKEINHAFALSLKSLTSFLVDGLSICTQEYATIIKEMWMDDDQSELSDTISSLFFKESDHATKILDAYQYLQNHIIYNIIIKHADTNA